MSVFDWIVLCTVGPIFLFSVIVAVIAFLEDE